MEVPVKNILFTYEAENLTIKNFNSIFKKIS